MAGPRTATDLQIGIINIPEWSVKGLLNQERMLEEKKRNGR